MCHTTPTWKAFKNTVVNWLLEQFVYPTCTCKNFNCNKSNFKKKVEIWIICYSACSYFHYINLQVCSIKYNTNHKIHFMTSINFVCVLAPECHPQGIVYFLRKWVICIVSEPPSFSIWQGCSSIWNNGCLLFFRHKQVQSQ